MTPQVICEGMRLDLGQISRFLDISTTRQTGSAECRGKQDRRIAAKEVRASALRQGVAFPNPIGHAMFAGRASNRLRVRQMCKKMADEESAKTRSRMDGGCPSKFAWDGPAPSTALASLGRNMSQRRRRGRERRCADWSAWLGWALTVLWLDELGLLCQTRPRALPSFRAWASTAEVPTGSGIRVAICLDWSSTSRTHRRAWR